MKKNNALLLLLTVPGLAASASAGPLTLTLSGNINYIATSNDSTPGITNGTPFSLTVDYNPADGTPGSCNSTSCIYTMSTLNFIQMTIGSFTENFDSGQYQNIEVFDQSSDEIILNALNYSGEAADVSSEFGLTSFSQDVLEVILDNPTGTAFTGTALPANPNLSLFTSSTIAYAVAGANGSGSATANIHGAITAESSSPITPEPGSALLLMAGVCAIVFGRLKR